MTDEELIARLRDACRGGDECKCSLSEAADRIEALVKERNAAEQRGYANAMEAERKLHEDRIEALTAERDCFKQRLQEEMALYAATSAERDAMKAAQIDAIRAALEAAADLCDKAITEGGLAKSMAFFLRAEDHAAYHRACEDYCKAILALDPAAIAAKLKGDSDEN